MDQRNPPATDALERLRDLLEAESSEGLKLAKDLEDNPICSVSFDESIPCISVVWKRYATSLQLRFIHESIIPMLEKHGVSKILGDDTALPTIHLEDQIWIVENWMPRAIAAGLKAGAGKSSASYFGKLSIDNIQSEAPADVVIRSFDEMNKARRWLQNFVPQPSQHTP